MKTRGKYITCWDGGVGVDSIWKVDVHNVVYCKWEDSDNWHPAYEKSSKVLQDPFQLARILEK